MKETMHYAIKIHVWWIHLSWLPSMDSDMLMKNDRNYEMTAKLKSQFSQAFMRELSGSMKEMSASTDWSWLCYAYAETLTS